MNPNQKEKLSCEERAKRKIKLQAEQEKLRVEEEAAIAMEEKRKLGAAKQRVETVLVEISGPNGLVGRCRIFTAVVVQLGMFRILFGNNSSTTVSDVMDKIEPNSTATLSGKVSTWTDMIAQSSNLEDTNTWVQTDMA